MSQLNPSEISSVLKEKIAGLDLSAERKNEGIVVSVSDGIVRIHGMGDVMYGEVIEFENGTKGMALNLEQDSVGAVVLGDYLDIIEGQKAVCTGKVLEVPVGEALLGRELRGAGHGADGPHARGLHARAAGEPLLPATRVVGARGPRAVGSGSPFALAGAVPARASRGHGAPVPVYAPPAHPPLCCAGGQIQGNILLGQLLDRARASGERYGHDRSSHGRKPLG